MPGYKLKIQEAKFKNISLGVCFFFFAVAFVTVLVNLAVTPVFASETLTFIHQDHLSSTILATNEQGEVVSRQSYYPYGSTQNTQGALPTERAYTSQVSDTDTTGLYYYNSRYYSTRIALFSQPDEKSEHINRYVYVESNPVTNTDPTGHQVFNPKRETAWEYRKRTGRFPAHRVWALSFYEHDYNDPRQLQHDLEYYSTPYNTLAKSSRAYFEAVIPQDWENMEQEERLNTVFKNDIQHGQEDRNRGACTETAAKLHLLLTEINIPSVLLDLKSEMNNYSHRVVAFKGNLNGDVNKWYVYDQDVSVKIGQPFIYSPEDQTDLKKAALVYKEYMKWDTPALPFGLPIGGDPLNLLKETDPDWLLKPPGQYSFYRPYYGNNKNTTGID